jgi:hypothetical protein
MKKIAQFCQKIARNGAFLILEITDLKYGNLKTKVAKIKRLILCDIFPEKMRPTPKISPKWRNLAQSGHTAASNDQFTAMNGLKISFNLNI